MSNWIDDLVDSSTAAKHVAWAGEVSFMSAREDDRTGRVVQLLLHREKRELQSAHPFSAHTRRRRGHAGTLFEASFSPIEAGPEFAGPVMLLNWGAGPKGETVTLLLNYEAEKHPFMAAERAGKDKSATRWMAVFVETDDQSAPVDQKQRQRVEYVSVPAGEADVDADGLPLGYATPIPSNAVVRKPKQEIKNSNLAAQFTKNPRFHSYLVTVHGVDDSVDQHVADEFIKAACGVASKAELDRDPTAAREFDLLRGSFVEWQLARYGPEEVNR